MIFQYTFENVLSENKTQTRRVIKSNDTDIRGQYNKIEAVLTNGRLKWAVGRTYAVQTGRCEPSIARVQITKITSQHIKYISTADAVKEGFVDRQDFLDTWRTIHGDNSMNHRVWVVNFKLVAIEAEGYPTISSPIKVRDFVKVK